GAVQTGTTTYTYYPHTGWLHSVNGPIADNTSHMDELDYTYDLDGRVVSTTMWTKAGGANNNPPSESFTTTATYNDAGEQLRIASDLSPDGSRQQVRDFSYTDAGLLASTTEYHGASSPLGTAGVVTTTNHYDPAGRLTSVDNPRGFTQQYVYDNLSR